MKPIQFILVGFLSCAASASSVPLENANAASKSENSQGGNPRGVSLTADHNTKGKSSSRFFGGMMPGFVNPNSGFFPSPFGGYNMGGFPTNQYLPPYGYMNGPMNYGGFYQPVNPGFYGNSFGGYATSQQQQQQQTSQMGTGGAAMGGFQPPFGG